MTERHSVRTSRQLFLPVCCNPATSTHSPMISPASTTQRHASNPVPAMEADGDRVGRLLGAGTGGSVYEARIGGTACALKTVASPSPLSRPALLLTLRSSTTRNCFVPRYSHTELSLRRPPLPAVSAPSMASMRALTNCSAIPATRVPSASPSSPDTRYGRYYSHLRHGRSATASNIICDTLYACSTTMPGCAMAISRKIIS